LLVAQPNRRNTAKAHNGASSRYLVIKTLL
jgi:hypothetical protein